METNSITFFNQTAYHPTTHKPIIAAWQIINPENIGNIIRLADNVGAEQVFILGSDFSLRMSSIKKTAGLSFNHIQLNFTCSEDFFNILVPDYQIVAIETCTDSVNIYQEKLPSRIVFMLGNERHGLPDSILEKCNMKVHIPMTGPCKSMNVSHALSVALFEWQRQMLFFAYI